MKHVKVLKVDKSSTKNHGKPMVNSPLIRPSLGRVALGGYLRFPWKTWSIVFSRESWGWNNPQIPTWYRAYISGFPIFRGTLGSGYILAYPMFHVKKKKTLLQACWTYRQNWLSFELGGRNSSSTFQVFTNLFTNEPSNDQTWTNHYAHQAWR